MDRLRRSIFRPTRTPLLFAGAALAAVCVALAVAALVLPGLVRRTAEERLQAALTVPARVGDVDLNLFTGRARLSDIVVEGASREPPILRLAALDVGVSYRALLRGTVVLSYLTFRDPRLLVERTGPESINVIQALRRGEAGGPLGLTVEQVSVESGVVTFVDRTQTPAFERTFTDLQLTTGAVSTLPELRLSPTAFSLRLGLGRGALTVTGETAPFGRPAGVELTARMEKLEPGVLRGYLPLRGRVDLRDSWVDGEVRYRLAYRGNEAIEHGLTARVETGPIRFLPPDDERALVSLGGLAGSAITADFLTNQVRLGDLVVRDPHVLLERAPDGTLNLARLIERTPPGPPAPPPAPAAPGATRQAAPPVESEPAVTVVVGQARLENGTVEFLDRTTRPVVAAVLRELRLGVRDVGVGPGAARPGRVEGEARVERGRLAVAGTVQSGSLATRLRVTARDLALPALRGYLESALPNAVARGGLADARLDVLFEPGRSGAARLELTGRVEGRRLVVALPDAAEPTLRAERLRIEVARLRLAPTFEADVAAIRLVGGRLRVDRDAGGELDVLRLWARPGAAAAGEADGGGPAPAASPVAVRGVVLERGHVRFTDRTVTPAFGATLAALSGDARPGESPDRLAVRLQGVVDNGGSLEVTGWIAPFAGPLRLALEGAVRDYELASLNPYVERYVSHRVERGRASLTMDVAYEAGRYRAEPRLTLQHVRLGQPLGDEFRERVGIPLGLAVSLLEDRSGTIDLRVPISGDAEGQALDLQPVIWQAVRQAVVKAVAAPFRLFGSILTAGGKIGELRIEPIGFRPGSLDPDDAATRRLAELVEFLRDKPRLSLELAGTAGREEVEPLKRERLRRRLADAPATGEGPLVEAYHDAGGTAFRDPPSHAEMEEYVLEHMEITEADLRRLAEDRARVIQEALVRRGVDAGQLFVASRGAGAVTGAPAGRVEVDILR
jgi:hypothetical protein